LKRLGQRLLVFVVYWLIRALRLTWKLEEGTYPSDVQGRIERKEAVAFGHFHEHDWPLIAFYFFRPVVVLVSLSQDGSLLTKFLDKLGFHVARGSSSRGAISGFRKMIETVHETGCPMVSLAVDGPRGPRRIAKKGLLKLAQHLDSPVVFGFVKTDRAWILRKSWSQAVIPKPFARMEMEYRELLSQTEVRESAKASDETEFLQRLQLRLDDFAGRA
jgi:lysophospholipid acyltransferase (LPLAT)-like uncharacterized protein